MSETRLSMIIAPRFFDVHKAVKAGAYTHYWLCGGRASTKSSYISIEIVQGIMRDRDANAVIMRKVANTLADSVVTQCLWAIDTLGVKAYWQQMKSPQELIYKPTGQRILFKGTDNAEKSKGIKLKSGYFKYVWFEELSEFDGMDEVETVFRSIVRGSGHSNIFYSYNPPKSKNNWVNAEAMIPKENRLVHHSTYLDVPPEWLGKQFIEEAEATKQKNELKYRWAYMGEATGTGGNVFDTVVTREITDAEIGTLDQFYDGLDFGYTIDPAAYIVAAYDRPRKRLYLTDEYYKVSASYDDIARAIRQKNPNNRVVIADSAEPRSIAELKARDIMIRPAKKGPGSIEHGIRWLQDLDEIIIDPKRTPNAAREFVGYEYGIDRYGNFKAKYPDENNHAIDAVRYAVSGLPPVIRDPIKADGQNTFDTEIDRFINFGK